MSLFKNDIRTSVVADLRQTKVRQFDMSSVRQQHVVRFQVSVDNHHQTHTHLSTLLKVNVKISTFRGRSQGLPWGRNISSSTKGRIVLPL